MKRSKSVRKPKPKSQSLPGKTKFHILPESSDEAEELSDEVPKNQENINHELDLDISSVPEPAKKRSKLVRKPKPKSRSSPGKKKFHILPESSDEKEELSDEVPKNQENINHELDLDISSVPEPAKKRSKLVRKPKPKSRSMPGKKKCHILQVSSDETAELSNEVSENPPKFERPARGFKTKTTASKEVRRSEPSADDSGILSDSDTLIEINSEISSSPKTDRSENAETTRDAIEIEPEIESSEEVTNMEEKSESSEVTDVSSVVSAIPMDAESKSEKISPKRQKNTNEESDLDGPDAANRSSKMDGKLVGPKSKTRNRSSILERIFDKRAKLSHEVLVNPKKCLKPAKSSKTKTTSKKVRISETSSDDSGIQGEHLSDNDAHTENNSKTRTSTKTKKSKKPKTSKNANKIESEIESSEQATNLEEANTDQEIHKPVRPKRKTRSTSGKKKSPYLEDSFDEAAESCHEGTEKVNQVAKSSKNGGIIQTKTKSVTLADKGHKPNEPMVTNENQSWNTTVFVKNISEAFEKPIKTEHIFKTPEKSADDEDDIFFSAEKPVYKPARREGPVADKTNSPLAKKSLNLLMTPKSSNHIESPKNITPLSPSNNDKLDSPNAKSIKQRELNLITGNTIIEANNQGKHISAKPNMELNNDNSTSPNPKSIKHQDLNLVIDNTQREANCQDVNTLVIPDLQQNNDDLNVVELVKQTVEEYLENFKLELFSELDQIDL